MFSKQPMRNNRFLIIVCLSLMVVNSAGSTTSHAVSSAGTASSYGSGFTTAGLTQIGGAHISGTRLRLTDSGASKTGSATSAVVNIPGIVGGSTAYVGFTGATGGQAAIQDILTWNFVASRQVATPTFKTLQIATRALPVGGVRVPYTAAMTAANGTPPYTWGITGGQLPLGLGLEASNGQISGTPTQAGSYTFSIQVRDASGQATSSNFSTNIVPASAPVISSIFPQSGSTSGGTLVTVNGSNFQTGATVLFGGLIASSVTVSSATQIQAVTPVHIAGTIDVTVRNSDSQSSVLSSGFAYNVLTPTMVTVSPNTGPATGGTTVTLTGTNFHPGAVVNFGTLPASAVTVNSPTEILAVSPANAAGAANVAVQNPDGLTAMLTGGFDYSSSRSGYMFHDSFESGNFSAWTTTYGEGRICGTTGGTACGVSIKTGPADVHWGTHSAQLHYFQNVDDNRAMVKSFSPGLTNFHLRGYVYFHNNNGKRSTHDIQRKLYYLKHMRPDNYFDWDVILSTHSNGGSSLQPVILVDTTSGRFPGCKPQVGIYVTNRSLDFDRWYSLELMVHVSDPGVANGSVNLWIDGAPAVFSQSPTGILNRCANGSDSNGINSLEVGMQLANSSGVALDEDRYWDDIVISDSYIGP